MYTFILSSVSLDDLLLMLSEMPFAVESSLQYERRWNTIFLSVFEFRSRDIRGLLLDLDACGGTDLVINFRCFSSRLVIQWPLAWLLCLGAC